MRLRILIVEDDMLISLALEDILERADHIVVGSAIDMDGALKAVEKSAADVAIMDVDLARGTSGVETARLLRLRHDIPSLFVSGRVTKELREMASEWEPAGFIGKPFAERQILDALKTVRGSA